MTKGPKSGLSIAHRLARVSYTHWLIAIGLYIFFAILVIWPIERIISVGFVNQSNRFTLDYIRFVFQDPLLVRGLVNAAIVAICVTGLSLAVSLPLAILTVRYDFRGRAILSGLLLAPLVLPPFVGAMGIRMALGRFGPISMILGAGATGIDWIGHFRLFGIVVVEALGLYPIMLLNIQASLANVDPAMTQAAANLGADRWTIFRQITFPLMRPGIFAGCTLVLIWSFTELGTPLMFDFYTITPVQVYDRITDVASSPLPYALTAVMLAASALLYFVGKVLLGRPVAASLSRGGTAGEVRRLHGKSALLAISALVAFLIVALVPHLSVVVTSFTATGAWYKSILPTHWTISHYRDALSDDLALPSVWNSIHYASGAMGIAVVVGIGGATVIVRSRLPGRQLLDSLCMLPLAAPGLVLAFGYLAISIELKRRFPNLPSALDVQENPTLVLILAYAARRLPYVVRSAVAGLQQTPIDLELAGANLGASRLRVFGKITFPLILGSLLAGALLAFAFAMLEVSDSLILAQRISYYPITKAILDLSQRLGDGMYIASALGVWAMALLGLTILTASVILGRRMGALFRV